jgi:succinate dehydrogenase flavin-adding protein (antitoxin of CptAB toxin-antitoxin module)
MKKTILLSTVPTVPVAKFALLLLLTFTLFTACGGDKKQLETLVQETETIHDEAMKDMAEMNRVARALKETMIAATMTPEQSAVYDKVLTNIGNAENDMMDWMKNYKPTDAMSTEDALKYIQDQKTAITKNHADIKAAMEAGKKLQGQ